MFSKFHGTIQLNSEKILQRRGCNNDWERNPNQTIYFLCRFRLNFQWTLNNQQHFCHKHERAEEGDGEGRYSENMLT